ncbi:hypothetical protein JRO89_XS01G0030900 [Xanthoceras sorbifolium]|uniref:S-protein homolog n=1 Tax=Xanthoceras sorbifolium TaxID=99658 RepID=A0ABQ8II03_9ROSI|nr:hypothetical protein JRO89_XS01G0030900 [Xanthoceras sorbifolium]
MVSYNTIVSGRTREGSKVVTYGDHVEDGSEVATCGNHVEEGSKVATHSNHVEEGSEVAAYENHVKEGIEVAAYDSHFKEGTEVATYDSHVKEGTEVATYGNHVEEGEDVVIYGNHVKEAIRPAYSPIHTGTWHMHVVNGMSHEMRLLVHCRSGDTDLGMKNVTAGTEFEWKFKMNFFDRTVYWCYWCPEKGKNSMLISMCTRKMKHFFTDAITATVFGLLEMMVFT